MSTQVEIKVFVLVQDGADEDEVTRQVQRIIQEALDERGLPEGAKDVRL